MKTRYFLLSAALVIATLFTGCTTDEIIKLNGIEVSKSFIGLEMNGGSQSIELTTNGPWAFEAFDADWLTISPTSGSAGKTTVTFTAGPSANDHSLELKITSGNETQYISVFQPGDPSLKPKYDEFKEGDYWIMFNNDGKWIVSLPVPDGSSYGYLYSTDAIVSGSELSSSAANAFTFKKVDGGFTIQDASGRYYYLSGTYTSCNVAAEMPASGAVCTVEQTGDYEFYVTNANGKWMQFSTGYSSMGVYDAPQAGGLLPYLVEMGEPPVEPLVLQTEDKVEMPQEGGSFETGILCLGDGIAFSVPAEAQSWLGLVVSKVDGDITTYTVNVAENPASNRSADILFKTNYNGNEYTATVTVSQNGAITPATVGEVDAASDDPNVLYRVQGYVSSVNNLAKGRFNIKDFSGEIYAYNIAAEPGGSTDLSGIIEEGDVVTIVGYKTSYQGKNELVGYLESFYPVETVTIAEFNAAEDAADVWYRITGVVTNGEGKTEGGVTKKFDLATYGNFDLVDETGSVYVYGVLTGLNGEKGKFGTLGVQEGDELTIVAAKKTYKDLIEADPTWYVSHVPAVEPEPEPELTVYLDEPFAEGPGAFTVENALIHDDLEYIWTFDSKYGMKASAFVNGTAYESESWLISPSMDLSEATAITLTFDQAANKFAENAYKDQCKVVAICGEETIEITIPEDKLLPGNSWTFVTTTLDLSSVASKSDVKVAFVYKSSTESCGTWEIKNVKVEDTPED